MAVRIELGLTTYPKRIPPGQTLGQLTPWSTCKQIDQMLPLPGSQRYIYNTSRRCEKACKFWYYLDYSTVGTENIFVFCRIQAIFFQIGLNLEAQGNDCYISCSSPADSGGRHSRLITLVIGESWTELTGSTQRLELENLSKGCPEYISCNLPFLLLVHIAVP
jgi:hypothetical protein